MALLIWNGTPRLCQSDPQSHRTTLLFYFVAWHCGACATGAVARSPKRRQGCSRTRLANKTFRLEASIKLSAFALQEYNQCIACAPVFLGRCNGSLQLHALIDRFPAAGRAAEASARSHMSSFSVSSSSYHTFFSPRRPSNCNMAISHTGRRVILL